MSLIPSSKICQPFSERYVSSTYLVIASTIPPDDFEPVYHNSELSIAESTESDTEKKFINTDNNQYRVGAVSCH